MTTVIGASTRSRNPGAGRKKLSGAAALAVLGDGWTKLASHDDSRPVVGICPDCLVASSSRTCPRCAGSTVGWDGY